MRCFFCLKIRLPPRSTRTDTLFPYTTLFRSDGSQIGAGVQKECRHQLARDVKRDGRHAQRTRPRDCFAHGHQACAAGAALHDFRSELIPTLPVKVELPCATGKTAKKPVLRSTHGRSEEHTSELQSLMRISYAVFGLQKKITNITDIKI